MGPLHLGFCGEPGATPAVPQPRGPLDPLEAGTRPLQVPPAHTRAFCAEVQPPLPHTGQPSSHAGNRAPWPACSPLPCIGLPSPGS